MSEHPVMHIEYHNHVDLAEVLHKLNHIIQHQHTIMATIQELNQKVADLGAQVTDMQATIDAEQQQITDLLAHNAQVVTDLNVQIATLTAQVAAAPTPEQLQGVVDGLQSISDNIATEKSDIEGTVAP